MGAGGRGSLADDAISIPVAHVPIRRMRARDRRNAVPARLLASDSAVPIVVVPGEGTIIGRGDSRMTRFRRGMS